MDVLSLPYGVMHLESGNTVIIPHMETSMWK